MIKDTLIREINKLKKQDFSEIDYLSGRKAYLQAISDIFEMLATLEVKDPYEQRIQYDSIKAGIQDYA